MALKNPQQLHNPALGSFQTEQGDVLLDTKTWKEEQSPFCIDFTERTYRRTVKDKVQTIKVITKRFTGPPGPIQRLKWKKFGAAATEDKPSTTIGPDVQFEFVKQPADHWIPNGIYVTAAMKDDWSPEEIKRIIRSDRPDQVYLKIYRSKIETRLAELKLEHAKKLEDRGLDAAETDTQSAPVADQKMGLRERMLLKQRNRVLDGKEAETSKSSSLSARLTQRREDAKQQHDEQKCTLFLQNIPEEYSETDIKSHIQDYNYRRVNVVRREGESVGKAFIELESVEETQRCLEGINGQKWGYCVIEVQLSKPKPKPGPGPSQNQEVNKSTGKRRDDGRGHRGRR